MLHPAPCSLAQEEHGSVGATTEDGHEADQIFKLKESSLKLVLRKEFFTMRVVILCNMLPREIVDTPFLEVFSVNLVGALSKLV